MIGEKNLLGVIGMCRGAGKATVGTEMVCELLRKKASRRTNKGDALDILVLEASDTSDNTHKKISDKCIYYNVKHVRLDSTCEILGNAVGKKTAAAVAIADKNFCAAIIEQLKKKQGVQ